MERKDFRKTGTYRYGPHDEGLGRTDETKVQLTGNISEAEIIVEALEVYVALKKALLIMGVKAQRESGKSRIGTQFYEKPRLYSEDLLAQIIQPDFIDEAASTETT